MSFSSICLNFGKCNDSFHQLLNTIITVALSFVRCIFMLFSIFSLVLLWYIFSSSLVHIYFINILLWYQILHSIYDRALYG